MRKTKQIKRKIMKFTEEEFSEKLKKSLTSDGKKPMQMSERTFKKFVGKIYKRIEKYDEESELDASVEEYLEELEELSEELSELSDVLSEDAS